MECRILACEREVFSGEVQGVYARGMEGWFGVLSGHAPAVFALANAPVRLVTEQGERTYRVKGGLVHVRRDGVVILADEVTEGA